MGRRRWPRTWSTFARHCRRAKKTRWRWGMSRESWPKSMRGRGRGYRWRGWSWKDGAGRRAATVGGVGVERLGREDARSRAQREQGQALVAQKEQARFDQEKALEVERGEFERLQGHAHTVGE